MPLDDDKARYEIFKAKDARYDGRFFVGVATTGIYCRPICRAKLPKAANCTFYATAAEAEGAGFRPCLVCRPELAPGFSPMDATASLARRAARMLEESCDSAQGLCGIAGRLGCTDRHLRRAFVAEYHVAPIQYLQTCKLLLAKNLLTDTNLSIIDVAMTAGFGSLRRFNDLCKKQYRLTPTALRKQVKNGARQAGEATVAVGYRPPYQWDGMLAFLAARAIPGVEAVVDGEYRRTVRLTTRDNHEIHGWLRVGHKPESHVLTVAFDPALLPVLPQVLCRIRHLFDLYCRPDAVSAALASLNGILPDLRIEGTRVPGCFDPFEMAVRAVLGQQITVKGARTLAARFAAGFGVRIETGIEGLTCVFPSAGEIARLSEPIGDHLGPLGVTGARAKTIRALASALAQGTIDFTPSADPEAEIEKLRAIPGIGQWTAHYIAMRAMGWTDAFPHTDYGVRKALAPRGEKEILALAEAWRPWRSYATVCLWNSL